MHCNTFNDDGTNNLANNFEMYRGIYRAVECN